MTEKNEKKVICTRIDKTLEERMIKYAEIYGISNSDLLRKALRYYLRYAHKDETDSGFLDPSIIITKEDFSYLLDNLNEEEIEELSENGYKSALRGIKKYFEQMGNEDIDPLDLKIKNILPIMDLTLSYNGQNWLIDFNYSIQKEIITFTGTHSLNIKFSQYLKLIFSKILKPYKYKLVSERIKDNTIYLLFEI
ncbi:MAG: hypothetical protein EU540_05185 [Promethearchaeota archaeon]|nr:MAG: hypothetical protein EU540_05185 [Candidatus Lokiarchaeota archaeon]